jgi:hypothetical protein
MKKGEWTFLTNHGRVLAYIATHPCATHQEIAQMIGLSIAGVNNIISDLKISGYVFQRKEGRCNRYAVQPDRPMRHRMEFSFPVGNILKAINAFPKATAKYKNEDIKIIQDG